MATRAQRLQFAETEFIPIAAMWFDVIGDCCHHSAILLRTHDAERFLLQLVLGAITPALQLIPVTPPAIDGFSAH